MKSRRSSYVSLGISFFPTQYFLHIPMQSLFPLYINPSNHFPFHPHSFIPLTTKTIKNSKWILNFMFLLLMIASLIENSLRGFLKLHLFKVFFPLFFSFFFKWNNEIIELFHVWLKLIWPGFWLILQFLQWIHQTKP